MISVIVLPSEETTVCCAFLKRLDLQISPTAALKNSLSLSRGRNPSRVYGWEHYRILRMDATDSAGKCIITTTNSSIILRLMMNYKLIQILNTNILSASLPQTKLTSFVFDWQCINMPEDCTQSFDSWIYTILRMQFHIASNAWVGPAMLIILT